MTINEQRVKIVLDTQGPEISSAIIKILTESTQVYPKVQRSRSTAAHEQDGDTWCGLSLIFTNFINQRRHEKNDQEYAQNIRKRMRVL